MDAEVRCCWILIDGVGDVGVPSLADADAHTPRRRTPLEAADMPTCDAIAAEGVSGLMDPVQAGLACGSDTAHLSMFGYDPRNYYRGRGAFETMGAGLEMEPGDIAFKCNFATFDRTTGIVVSRRADRNFEDVGPALCASLTGIKLPNFPQHSVAVKYATEHRCGVRVRGPGLSDNISGTDPLKDNLPLRQSMPLDSTFEAARTSSLVNELSRVITDHLEAHEVNRQRHREGKALANAVLLRGCGARIRVPTFAEQHGLRAFMIAPTCLIRGLGMSIDMRIIDAPGATGDYHTDLHSKARTALATLLPSQPNTSAQLPSRTQPSNTPAPPPSHAHTAHHLDATSAAAAPPPAAAASSAHQSTGSAHSASAHSSESDGLRPEQEEPAAATGADPPAAATGLARDSAGGKGNKRKRDEDGQTGAGRMPESQKGTECMGGGGDGGAEGGEEYNLGFVHVKAVDDAGHDKSCGLKLDFLRRIDDMIALIVHGLAAAGAAGPSPEASPTPTHPDSDGTAVTSPRPAAHPADGPGTGSPRFPTGGGTSPRAAAGARRGGTWLVCVTGDHSTPVDYGDHSSEPVPFAIAPAAAVSARLRRRAAAAAAAAAESRGSAQDTTGPAVAVGSAQDATGAAAAAGSPAPARDPTGTAGTDGTARSVERTAAAAVEVPPGGGRGGSDNGHQEGSGKRCARAGGGGSNGCGGGGGGAAGGGSADDATHARSPSPGGAGPSTGERVYTGERLYTGEGIHAGGGIYTGKGGDIGGRHPRDGVERFDEIAAAGGALGRFQGSEVLGIIKRYAAILAHQ